MSYSIKLSPDDLGPYGKLVHEALTLALDLFAQPACHESMNRIVAYTTLPPLYFPDNGPGNIHFNDIRPGEPSFNDLIDDEFGPAVVELGSKPYAEAIANLFDDSEFRAAVFERIPADLLHCRFWLLDHLGEMAYCRAAFGQQCKFMESLFKAYRSGGFPFGFQFSDLGEVELLVYYPASHARIHDPERGSAL